MSCTWSIPSMVGAALLGVVSAGQAQPLGTFRWQLQPYCNIVTLAVTQHGGIYTLDGHDDQCGAATRAPLTGVAMLNPDGSIGLGLHIVVTPGASPIHVAAAIALTTLNGTWRDHSGGSGSFVLTAGAGTGGNPRPVATTTQWIPNLFALQPDGGLLARGDSASGTIPASGPGTRMMWFPAASAFRAGTVSGTQWDSSNIGYASVAFGASTLAGGIGAVAGGFGTTASGFQAVAFGNNVRATGDFAFAAGRLSAATGTAAVAFGEESTAGGLNSFAAGFRTFAIGVGAAAVGVGTRASGQGAFASGDGTVAERDGAVAMGLNARASAAGSVALGWAVTTDWAASGAVVLGSHAIAGSLSETTNASGSFIFGDRSTNNDLLSLGRNEFLMRVAGGVRIYTSANLGSGVTVAAGGGAWSSLSDEAAKENFREVNEADVLARLARLPIREWNYKTQDAAIRHVGPTAQDFRAAFGLGEDTTRISTIDADGIALAAIQALEARTRALQQRIDVLEQALVRATGGVR